MRERGQVPYAFDRKDYLVNPRRPLLPVARGFGLPAGAVHDAVGMAHGLIDQVAGFDVDVFPLLGMRNLSAFMGELFAASMIKVTGDAFRKNPHQDGYPDLLLMDEAGRARWGELEGRRREKAPFSPFLLGGIEVKATCGSVPEPAQLARRGAEKPGMGDQRVGLLTGYDWKAHHRDTNNLMAIVWDFIDKAPRIVAVFYCDELTTADWGAIVQPKKGGGRTTSVSTMARSGITKMTENWVIALDDDDYLGFFRRRNPGVPMAG